MIHSLGFNRSAASEFLAASCSLQHYSYKLTCNLINFKKDFIPAMISKGAAAADSAMIIIDASPGNFESGFNKRGQTREHLIIIRALGCSKIIVAVNKMDSVQFNQDRFNQIKAEVGAFLASIGFAKVLFENEPYGWTTYDCNNFYHGYQI